MFDHKSLKWWKKIFFALIEVSFVNTMITYINRDNDNMTAAEKNAIDRNAKRVEIIESLLEDYQRKPNKRGRQFSNPPPMRIVERHFDGINPNRLADGKAQRLECIVCKPPAGKKCRTTNWCKQCRVAVHRYECFERLHMLGDYTLACAGPGSHP